MTKKILLITLIGIMLLSVGCSNDRGEITDEDNNNLEEEIVDENDKDKEKEEEVDEIEEIVNSMTLDEKIGQLLVFGLDGTVMDEHVKEMIEKNNIGGFILFGNNISDENQTVELLNSLKRTNAQNSIPLFLATDEEGGMVSRLPDSFSKLPNAKKIGDMNDRNISLEYGKILGARIKELGFNMNFAPVLDINSNPNNPVIGNRAFGSDVDTVVDNGLQVMRGINSEKVISVVKHFPGHGDTNTDSHIDLPVIDKEINELENLELVPFKEAINTDADGIMIAHILFQKLDAHNPSTLSYDIINGLLREKLSYDGVVISDDMTMGAIADNYTIEEASVKFLKAGGDLLLICHGYENQINVLNRIKQEVESHNITEEELDEKVYRIIRLKKAYNLQDSVIDEFSIEDVNSRTKEVLKRID